MFLKKPDLLKGIGAGIIAGIAAAWLMEQFQAVVSHFEGKPQDSGEPATVKAANHISRSVVHHPVPVHERELAGEAMHYAMGAVSGGIYGALAEINPAAAAGAGTIFGAVLWVAADEVAVPALGLSKPPLAIPPEVHAKALASHVVYGVSTELMRRCIRRTMIR